MGRPFDEQRFSGSAHAVSDPAQLPTADEEIAGQCSPAVSTGSNSSPPAGGARAYWIWVVSGFLLLAVGLVFGQTVRHKFIGYDDQAFVYQNPHVTPGLTLEGLWWALTSGPLKEWCPLTSISHQLDCQLYHLNPGGHYLTNVLLHAASSVLLFLVLLRMTGDLWPSAWVAAIFAIHPLHVESVAWVAERRDTLSGLFFMLTLFTYARYVERPSPARYLAVCGCLALGLMSKSMLVTVPCVLLLLDYWPLNRLRPVTAPAAEPRCWFGRLPVGWRLLVEKIPLFALSAISCWIVMSGHGLLPPPGDVEPSSLATRLAIALVAYGAYLGESFYPVDLAPFYPHPGTRLPVAWICGSLVVLATITAVAAWSWRRRPYVLVGWLWFLGMLVPVLGVMGEVTVARADRYTYLSQIGLSIAVAWGVRNAFRPSQSVGAARWRTWTLALGSTAAVLALAAVAWRQTSYWRDAETLWTHALACTENNAQAHHCLAFAYYEQGRFDEAVPQLRAGLAAGSNKHVLLRKSQVLLGTCLASQGKFDEAAVEFERAARMLPSSDLQFAVAASLTSAGKHDQAIAEWKKVIRLMPDVWIARENLAEALLTAGRPGEAAEECRELLKEHPGAVKTIVLLGMALTDQGQIEEGVRQFEWALELAPGFAPAHFHLGLALNDLGRSKEAQEHLDTAVRLVPDKVLFLWQTAWNLATSPDSSVRDGARGIKLATRALELSQGQELRALDALAAALAEDGQFPAAADMAWQASITALAQNNTALADALGARARLYRSGVPFRQSPPSQAADAEPSPGEAPSEATQAK